MRKFYFALVIMVLPFMLNAQNLEDYLSKYTSANGEMYLQPFADAFSADFNSGLFHNAEIKKKGFQLYIGVVGQVAIIPNSAKTFTAFVDDPAFGDPIYVPNAPTVFGSTEGPSVEHPGNGLEYQMPGGFDVEYLPLAMPQITIGSLYGTDFTLRYASVKADDFGTVEVFGWGVRHSIDQYWDKLPLNLVAGYYRQSFKIGEYMDAKTNVINLQTSIALPIVTFYGGLGYENSKVDVQYTYEGIDPLDGTEPGDKIEFKMEGANTVRATVGLCLNLGPVKLHGDYNIAKQNTFAVGLGIGINQK